MMSFDSASGQLGHFDPPTPETVIALAIRGDGGALRILRNLVPRRMSRSSLRVARDEAIRALARDVVFAAIAGATDNQVAVLLAAAGKVIAAGGNLNRREFSALGREDRERLEQGVRTLLLWVPCWPRTRQLRKIIGPRMSYLSAGSNRSQGLPA
jgi:hypothetical protein